VELGRRSAARSRSGGAVLRDGDLHFLEIWNELRNWISQTNLALFYQHENSSGGNWLSHGGDAENRVLCHGSFRFDVHNTMRFKMCDLPFSGNERDSGGDITGINVALHGLVDSLQTLRGKSGGFFANAPRKIPPAPASQLPTALRRLRTRQTSPKL